GRLLPLRSDLVVSRARNVYALDLRQRFQRTDFVEADHDMSGSRGVDAFLHGFALLLGRVGIVGKSQEIIRDGLGRLEELVEIAARHHDLLRLADLDERHPGTRNNRVDIDEPPDGPCRRDQRQKVPFVGYSDKHDVVRDVSQRFDDGCSAVFIGRVGAAHGAVHEHRRKAAFFQFSREGGVEPIFQPIEPTARGGGDVEDEPCSSIRRRREGPRCCPRQACRYGSQQGASLKFHRLLLRGESLLESGAERKLEFHGERHDRAASACAFANSGTIRLGNRSPYANEQPQIPRSPDFRTGPSSPLNARHRKVRYSGRIEPARAGGAASGVRMCSRRMPRPTRRAGRRRNTGNHCKSLTGNGTPGRSVLASARLKTLFWICTCSNWIKRIGTERRRCIASSSAALTVPAASRAASAFAAATSSWMARLMPTPPTGHMACAASPMHKSPGRCHCRSRSTATVSSLTSSQPAISPIRSRRNGDIATTLSRKAGRPCSLTFSMPPLGIT